MTKIDIGTISAGLICPKCKSTDFETDNNEPTDTVRCKKCGHEVGTLKEVRDAQMAAVKKQAPLAAKKAIQDALKGVKGFKKR